ncbi:MAG: DUF4434 domain-containing protein [bacterium]|nr:MAG: DUF4434 domain-containing protein [bacterium]
MTKTIGNRVGGFHLLILILLFPLLSPLARMEAGQAERKPIKVEVRNVAGAYQLFRNGESYYIKGAGGGLTKLSTLAEHGGNSLRTWSSRNAEATLDSAYTLGITVLLGLDVKRERHGFDYNDLDAVQKQLDKLKIEVQKYKDHPALLGWGIGNELNLHYSNKKVWNAVDDIAKMIHEIDGNHPATTMLAGIHKEEVDYIRENCQNLDFLSVQMYADIINVRQRIAEAGWTGPYAVTEWGATGHWEVPKTDWGAAIEHTSTERAALVRERFEKSIMQDTLQCLGSFIFLWGRKQERTPTWYGLFLEDGEEMESIDVMHYLWTGDWPQNRSPQIYDVVLEGKTRYDNIRLRPAEEVELRFRTQDFDRDSLQVIAELLRESTDLGEGGDYESRPETITGLIMSQHRDQVVFRTPTGSGAYRIFVYIKDGQNHAATANVPFYVE